MRINHGRWGGCRRGDGERQAGDAEILFEQKYFAGMTGNCINLKHETRMIYTEKRTRIKELTGWWDWEDVVWCGNHRCR